MNNNNQVDLKSLEISINLMDKEIKSLQEDIKLLKEIINNRDSLLQKSWKKVNGKFVNSIGEIDD